MSLTRPERPLIRAIFRYLWSCTILETTIFIADGALVVADVPYSRAVLVLSAINGKQPVIQSVMFIFDSKDPLLTCLMAVQ